MIQIEKKRWKKREKNRRQNIKTRKQEPKNKLIRLITQNSTQQTKNEKQKTKDIEFTRYKK